MLNIKKQSGWHVPINIHEENIIFLVDSGASCTMIDTLTYHKLTKFNPLPLSPITDIFVLADGSQLSVLGEVEFEGRIRDEYYPMTAIVAELGDNAAILGLDFMENNDVILRLSTGKLMVGMRQWTCIGSMQGRVAIGSVYVKPWLSPLDLAEWLRWMWTLGKLPINLTRGKRIALWNVYPLLLNLQG